MRNTFYKKRNKRIKTICYKYFNFLEEITPKISINKLKID